MSKFFLSQSKELCNFVYSNAGDVSAYVRYPHGCDWVTGSHARSHFICYPWDQHSSVASLFVLSKKRDQTLRSSPFALWWLTCGYCSCHFVCPLLQWCLSFFLQGELDHKSARHLCYAMVWIRWCLVSSYRLWTKDLCGSSRGTPKQHHKLGRYLLLIWEVFLVSLLLAGW